MKPPGSTLQVFDAANEGMISAQDVAQGALPSLKPGEDLADELQGRMAGSAADLVRHVFNERLKQTPMQLSGSTPPPP